MQDRFTKKVIASALSCFLLVSSTSVALATSMPAEPAPKSTQEEQKVEEGALKKEEAIKIAKSIIPLPEGYELQASYYNSSSYYEPSGSWRLEFVKKEGNEWVGNISYGINAKTGELIQYSSYSPNQEAPAYPPKVAKEKAKKLADEFLAKITPEKAKQVMLDSSFAEMELPIMDSRQNYYFSYVRTHNGIQFPNNGLFVEVSTEGKIVNFHLNWNENVVFPKEKVQVTIEQATEKFNEIGKEQMSLQYLNPWNSMLDEMFISYQFNPYYQNSAAYIDAVTGKPLNYELKEVNTSKIEYDKVSDKKLDPYFKNRKEDLTEKEAVEHLWKVTGLKAENYTLEHSGYYSNEYGQNLWNFTFIPKDAKPEFYQRLHVAIDARTGQFTQFSNENWGYMEGKKEVKSTFTKEEIEKKAKEGFIKFSPNTAHEAVLVSSEQHGYPENSPYVYFHFTRLVNGVVDSTFGSSIGIDRETGEVVSFHQYSDNRKKYPTTDNLISKEEALAKIMAQYQVVLQYQIVYPEYHHMEKYPTEAQPMSAKLVYQLRSPATHVPVFLNAKNGEWHSLENGELIRLDRKAPVDIEKHWAKDALNLMFKYRALDTDDNGKINPNAKMKRGEMIKMLILAVNQGRFYGYYGKDRAASFADVGHKSEYFQYVEAAVDMKILDKKESKNFNPDAPLSREDMAVLIVKALGYNKLAKFDDLFNLDVKDASKIKNKGHVAIVNHLGIMSSQKDGNFLPEKEVTRAEAAMGFYKYLQKRVELVDTPMYHPYYH